MSISQGILFQEEDFNYDLPDAEIRYFPNFFTSTKSTFLLDQLLKTIEWKQNTIKMYGKENPVPRLEAWYGDKGKSYAYSGIKMEPSAWTDDLILIQDSSSGTGVTAKQPFGKVSLSVFDSPSADLSFGNFKLIALANGTASKDAVNLGQVQALVAGVGVFQGGYDASANSPAIAGASNIALTTGDFFVVTKDGTIAFNGSTVDVEVGDTI